MKCKECSEDIGEYWDVNFAVCRKCSNYFHIDGDEDPTQDWEMIYWIDKKLDVTIYKKSILVFLINLIKDTEHKDNSKEIIHLDKRWLKEEFKRISKIN